MRVKSELWECCVADGLRNIAATNVRGRTINECVESVVRWPRAGNTIPRGRELRVGQLAHSVTKSDGGLCNFDVVSRH